MKDLYLEKNISQAPAIELLKSLGYTYISPKDTKKQRLSSYDVLLRDILREQLIKINKYEYAGEINGFSETNIQRAIEDIDIPLNEGLAKSGEKIFSALSLGQSYSEFVSDGKTLSFNLKYIDWVNLGNNVFHVTEEFAVHSLDKEHNARPDIVLFINGIPFAVIECKPPQVHLKQGISQMIRNQRNEYIPQLFKYAQLLMVSNVNSISYATSRTPEKFWSVWKEENTEFLEKEISSCVVGRIATEQDKGIISLFNKERVYDFIKYFILYDANVKKVCRYQQYFAIKETIKTIENYNRLGNRNSGVIWHTQGSGKSLTMVMLAKYILMELSQYNPKVVIITDRKELDSQIAKTFTHTKLKPAKATSGKNLGELINSNKADVITTIINKFDTAEREGIKNESSDIFVLVDESHRSNYGSMSTKMRTVLPNACYIGFTGTPLMKDEKNTMSKFGNLIHKYTIKDGVEDGAIVPLIYEGKFVEQELNQESIDLWFDEVTKKLNEKQKEALKNKWSSIRKINSTDARIKRIALDINIHFSQGYLDTGFKAMFATNRKKDAIRYLECFEQLGTLKCAVVMSPPDIREGVESIEDENDDKVNIFWNKMMEQYSNADYYEESIKNQFQDGEIDILIVCSKLLTGFDAPICQILYIDKELKEHSLLQAIARTNRLSKGKDYGLIVDYRGLITKLNDAMDMYTGAGLEKFDISDLKGTIIDIISAIGELRNANSNLEALFVTLNNKFDVEEVEISLAEEERRELFYKYLCDLGKQLNIVLNSEQVYESINRDELENIKNNFTFHSKIRRSVKIRYADDLDYVEYETIMQNLLNTHLSIAGLKQITNPVDILNKNDFEKELEELGSNRAKADAIVSSMTKTISKCRDENPAYYDSFSKKINLTLEEYKNRVISEKEYLEKMKKIMQDFCDGKTDFKYPKGIEKNPHAQAFYGVITSILNNKVDIVANEEAIVMLTIEVNNIIESNSQIDWTKNTTIHKKIAQDIDDLFFDIEKQYGMQIEFSDVDMVIENVKTVALRRF